MTPLCWFTFNRIRNATFGIWLIKGRESPKSKLGWDSSFKILFNRSIINCNIIIYKNLLSVIKRSLYLYIIFFCFRDSLILARNKKIHEKNSIYNRYILYDSQYNLQPDNKWMVAWEMHWLCIYTEYYYPKKRTHNQEIWNKCWTGQSSAITFGGGNCNPEF